jgi:glyoxylase-like metal-dependent hydrolase (beta-lactamase superfamily II)
MAIATGIEEISKGVWSWHGFDDATRTEFFSTAVLAEDGLVILDPILSSTEALNRLGKISPVAAIVLTNGNHSRAAARFRERFSAPVFAHPDAVGELTSPVDGTLRTHRKVGGSLEVIELPGAGPGEVALYQEGAWLHLGDALIHLEDTGLAVLPAKYCVDAPELALSLQKLKALRFDNASFAHGVPLRGDAAAKIGALLAQNPYVDSPVSR